MMNHSDIVEINKDIAGGKVLNPSMVDASLASYYYYDNVKEQISSIFRGIIKNHAFFDGNKRTGLVVLSILSEQHDLSISKTEEELAQLVIDVATKNIKVEEIAKEIFG